MSFDWSEYLSVAQELLGVSVETPLGQEARSRSAISRAYYAAFISARNHLRDKERWTFRRNKVHQAVRAAFVNSGQAQRRWIGSQLNRLSKSRNKADYDDAFPGIESEKLWALAQARRVLDSLERL